MKKTVIHSLNLSEKCKSALKRYAERSIETAVSPFLHQSVNTHPDTLFFYYEDKLFTGARYRELMPELSMCPCEIIETSDAVSPYPGEALLNCFYLTVAGKNILFGNLKHIDKTLASYFDYAVSVNQGYAHCSSAKISDSAVITSDKGIADAVCSAGANALLIESGYIELPGFDYGFIGGASVLCENELLFFGDVKQHPDYLKMKKFAKDFDVTLRSLSDEKLCDFGGGLFI
ncbi:MAG: hypothetical protein PUB34_06870 [Clostridia bacterium]|nr:hypothetical protein [Clostridia bacterium]